MNSHFYAFGSLCRGEVDAGSDIDILVCTENDELDLDKEKYSIYKYSRIEELWTEGNPFAWHLSLESKLLFASNNIDFIKELGLPSPYRKSSEDCEKFRNLFLESYDALKKNEHGRIFNLSCLFLATRNFATCFSLGLGKPIFSRMSPFLIDRKLEISDEAFNYLVRARILSTRGKGEMLSDSPINKVIVECPNILEWMNCLSGVEQ